METEIKCKQICKIVIFSRDKVNKYPKIVIGEKIIEVVSSFVYLGLKLNYNSINKN